ncbi:Glucose/ribitol dehydrogenase [Carpediemonas membranifera]|uniref:Glucose/ribitol dehydrogenase n=1 Tax=Carpediemonas membranifera TaxID=201153 RepID=A0A8J6E3X7_9EUKA|nr:Glucose/ribitol dehydrogenase [Carpediemonas membranifera]|eukprot:KAG9396146.1 Glucose/ribitol dehydrogenase [Carpediemonas membranifera]
MTKVAIVTGGSSGIGLAICKVFLKDGDFEVYNLDVRPFVENIGSKAHYIQCDVTSFNSVHEAVEAVRISTNQRIDVLVSNAGIHYSAILTETPEAVFDRVMAINVKGAYAVSHAVLPTMVAARSGVVVFVGSDQCFVGKPGQFAYNMSKAALASITRTTALDYAQYGIRANAVCPGTIDTPLFRKAVDGYIERTGVGRERAYKEEDECQPLGRVGRPEEVADFVFFLASEKAGFITGSLHPIDGGYTAQ